MALVTSDPALCIPQAELIFIAGLPIHHNPTVLRSIKPHMDMTKKVFVGSICAYGGFNWVAAEALGPGAYSLFGTRLVPNPSPQPQPMTPAPAPPHPQL